MLDYRRNTYRTGLYLMLCKWTVYADMCGGLAMKYFELIGRRQRFMVLSYYAPLWGVPCVNGITPDGKYRTSARLEDIICVDGQEDW